jgi:tripartite-type tricarboxylate transporter receptor subunit TctC
MFRALLCLMVLTTLPAKAGNYPSRPITIVVPHAAGGPTDAVSRLVANAMSADLGQTLVVENIGGAGGTLGTARFTKAAPDGYTLMIHHIALATTATMYRDLPYDTMTAFAPIGLITDVPMTIIAREDFAPNTLAELVAHLKANGEKVTYGNAGLGSASHLCAMLFMKAIDVKLTGVPFKGTGPAMASLLGKEIDVMCDQATNTTTQIQNGKVKAYASVTPKRLPKLPDLPTAEEAGLKNLEISIWHGLYALKGTPPDVVERLTVSLRKALADPTVMARFGDLNTAPSPASDARPEVLEAKLKQEVARWADIIKDAGAFAQN